jgi:hypothetical protein
MKKVIFNFRIQMLIGLFVLVLLPEHGFAEGDQLARHEGVSHGVKGGRHSPHHGMGRASKGICPQTRKTLKAPKENFERKNPFKATRENLQIGQTLYNLTAEPTTCKICHGVNGNGLGMMAQGKNPMPRNFTCAKTMKDVSDGQMFWIIENGSPGAEMPAYKFLTDDQIWRLILYIRTFNKEK